MLVGEGQTETFFELAVKFVQRVLVINSHGTHKQDGVTILRVVIAILENLPRQIDHALPHMVGMLLAELKMAFENGPCPKNFKAMLLQSIAMAVFNNNSVTLRIIENEGQTFSLFSNWLGFMQHFKLEFEIRRIVFGLCAILKTPVGDIPPVVQ